MTSAKINNRIEWLFIAAAVVVAAWLLFLQTILPDLIGPDSAFRGLIGVDSATPLGFVLVALAASAVPIFGYVAIWFYRTILWKLNPWSGYKGGWWVYGIELYPTEKEKDPEEVIGIFKFDHTGPGPEITDGRGWEISNINHNLVSRRRWDSNKVWIDKETGTDQCKLTIIYQLIADKGTNPDDKKGWLPREYSGIIQGDFTDQKTMMVPRRKRFARKKRIIEGSIQGLNQRRDIAGKFYAELLPRNINYTKSFKFENDPQLEKTLLINRFISWVLDIQKMTEAWWETEYMKISSRKEAEDLIRMKEVQTYIRTFLKEDYADQSTLKKDVKDESADIWALWRTEYMKISSRKEAEDLIRMEEVQTYRSTFLEEDYADQSTLKKDVKGESADNSAGPAGVPADSDPPK